MKPLHRLRALLAVTLFGASLACSASPLVWTESGDSGETLATANDASGISPILGITGALSNEPNAGPDRVDLFRIDINNTSAFSALTIDDFSVIADPVLFLFDAAGIGVAMDDESGGNGKARLTMPSNLAPGTYFLAIAFAGMEPLDGNGDPIFDTFGDFSVLSASPLDSWGGSPFVIDPSVIGAYQIDITLPETGTLLLASLAIALAARARRRRC